MDKEQTEGSWNPAVKKRKLNYRFHNPNPTAATADYILKILIEANEKKVEEAMQKASCNLSETY
jgi:hypothetical protein